MTFSDQDKPVGVSMPDPNHSSFVGALYSIAFGRDTTPDRWQHWFADDVWPEVLIAPTGSGKTAGVTLGWAVRRIRVSENTPRRLVWCLPMRTLVEQTADVVKRWFERLKRVDCAERTLPGPEDIHVLMGGAETARWLDFPERPAILIGTQDMLLSRALMRGYASLRTNWPIEFALLHRDSQWVFDEVQLMGAGRATSTQLEAFRRSEAKRARYENLPHDCPARSLWISATLEPGWLATVDFPVPKGNAIRRVDPNNEEGVRLRQLATAKKTLTRVETSPASSKPAHIDAYIEQLACRALDEHRPGHMTLLIVNRVLRARQLYAALDKERKKRLGNAPELALIHGRFRLSDRLREMDKVVRQDDKGGNRDLIVVATQAVEAGVDISAAVMFAELAPWSAMVQRFGRANRYAELENGADVRWIDLLADVGKGKAAEDLSLPYSVQDLQGARELLRSRADVASGNLPPSGNIEQPLRVIRRKDLDDLFDTDSDLTGFDVDISPYVRDAKDTDVRIFWRDLSVVSDVPPSPGAEELCTVPIGDASAWISKCRKRDEYRIFVRDPQWRRSDQRSWAVPGWISFAEERPWPGLTLLADIKMGGYSERVGFTGDPKDVPNLDTNVRAESTEETDSLRPDFDREEGHDEDPRSEIGVPVFLSAHLGHVAAEAERLCAELDVDAEARAAIVRAARWHDVGKIHEVFQNTMKRGLGDQQSENDVPLAKTVMRVRHERSFFRHELASALAFLIQERWSRDADLVAYLIAAHHGKVRMNLRALPRERFPAGNNHSVTRFARGIWEGDKLRRVELGAGERWEGGCLTLSIMELGWDKSTKESWTERTHGLLDLFGPFELAWMESLVRIADWRASAKEREKRYDDV